MGAQSILRASACRLGVILALVLASLSARLQAQKDARLLATVRSAYERLARRLDVASVRAADRTLARLGALRYGSREIRRQATTFLKGVAQRPGPASILRVRVAAVKLLVDLSEEPETVAFLLSLARRAGEHDLEGLDFFIEQALQRIHRPAQVHFLVRHLRDSRDQVVRTCVSALGHLEDPDLTLLALPQTPRLVDLARAAEPQTRAQALELLGRLPDVRALPPLVEAARAPEALVRLAAAQALGGKTDRRGVDLVLSELLADPLPRVREVAAHSFRTFRSLDHAAQLVERLGREPLRIRHTIAASLQHMTGQDLGTDAGPWRTWIKAQREGVGLGKPFRGRQPRYAPNYYGIPMSSDRVVFVLDISGSMAWSKAGKRQPSRLDIAKQELIKVLRQLTAETRFNIVTFSWTAVRFQDSGLVPASHARVQEAIKFVNRQQPAGGTNTYEALRMAFQDHPTADTIYILTDGSPTVGSPNSQEQILYRVHRWNRLRRVRINGIALLVGEAPTPQLALTDDRQDARRFMKLLARQTGGSYAQRP